MMNKEKQSFNWLWVYGAVVAIAVVVWGVRLSPRYPYEQALIFYRYARQLQAGSGLVFNTGEWVLGTPSPLYSLLLGVFGRWATDWELWGHTIGVIFWALSAWGVVMLFSAESRPYSALLAPLFLIIHPAIGRSLGMDTPMVVALMIWSAWAWLYADRFPRLQTALCILLSAALILTRYDGFFWIALLIVERWRTRRRWPFIELGGIVILCLIWVGYALWRFGTPFPPFNVQPISWQFLVAFWRELTASNLLVGVGLLGLCGLGIWLVVREQQRWWWLLAWFFSYQLFGIFGFYDLSERWVFVPALLVVWLLAGLAISRAEKNNVWMVIITLLVAPSLARFAPLTWRESHQSHALYYLRNRDFGNWLAESTAPESVVASADVGAIGYFSQRPMLIKTDVAPLATVGKPLQSAAMGLYLTQQMHPDHVVIIRDTPWEAMSQTWWFSADFQQMIDFEQALIYARHDRPNLISIPVDQPLSNWQIAQLEVVTTTLTPLATFDSWLTIEINAPMTDDGTMTIFLTNSAESRLAETKIIPFDGLADKTIWRVGQSWRIPLRLNVAAELSGESYQLGIERNGEKIVIGRFTPIELGR